MAFTIKYLQRLNVDELKELLSDDEAELTDAEKERIGEVVTAKEAKPDPEPEPEPEPKPPAKPKENDEDDPPWLSKVVDGVSEKVIGNLTAAEEIVDSVTGENDPEPEPEPEPEPKPKGENNGGEPEPNGEDESPRKRSLAGRFYGT